MAYLKGFPWYYRIFALIVSLLLGLSIFGCFLTVFYSFEPLQSLLFGQEVGAIIVAHSDWSWILKIILFIGYLPIPLAIGSFLYTRFAPLNFQIYMLRQSRHPITQLNTKEGIIIIVFVLSIGCIAHFFALRTYTRFTPNRFSIHDSWNIGHTEQPYSEIERASITYTIEPARGNRKSYTKTRPTHAFSPKFVVKTKTGREIVIWDYMRHYIDANSLETIIAYLRQHGVLVEIQPLHEYMNTMTDTVEYGWMIPLYQRISSPISN